LVVRPYLEKMTRSELMSLMTGGFATIAGAVLVAYTAMGLDPAHLLTASVMSAPAALVIAKLLVPETEAPLTTGAVEVVIPSTAVNVIDAAAQGTTDGLKLALNVGAMLVAFVALMFFADAVLVWFGDVTGLSALITSKLDPSFDKLTLGAIFGYIFRPLAWLIGVPWEDAARYGTLIGTQLTLTEFVAYLKLAEMIPTSFEPGGFSPRATMIATYGLCAFANVGSIGIQLGGIGALVESRRGDLAKLAVRAMLAGILAANMTAAVAGALVTEAEADFRQARSIARLHLGKGELEAADDMLLRVAENRKDDRWGQRAGALAIQVGSLAEQIQAGEITSDQAKARVE
ncbi:MAG: NupC/NupG family nucleoside CNT transporter, partial [Planctomycetota bacterium]